MLQTTRKRLLNLAIRSLENKLKEAAEKNARFESFILSAKILRKYHQTNRLMQMQKDRPMSTILSWSLFPLNPSLSFQW
jgi:hypothetical protein